MQSKKILVKCNELSKKYSGGFCFAPASFSLHAGETVAFLGANGAGKSTLFQMLTGNSDPTSGSIYFLEQKLNPESFKLKQKIGYLPQHMQLPKWVTGKEILSYAASLYNIADPEPYILETLKYWDCQGFMNKPLASCSHGMQKRIALALSTFHNPECLILDEPFSGLDIFHTKALENKIIERQNMNKTTIISTHIVHYVAKLCHRVFLVEQGKLGTMDQWDGQSILDKIGLIESFFFKEEESR